MRRFLPAQAGGLCAACLAAALLAGCAAPRFEAAGTVRDADGDAGADPRAALVQSATAAIGTPYRYGGATPAGFDCSGLVQYAHRRIGIEIPRTTDAQWQTARTPARRRLLPGDLLFFEMGGAKDRHVGIYEGDGVFIHAPSPGKRVGRASLDNPYWQDRLIGARTFL